MTDLTLREDFLADHKRMAAEFDKLAEDHFQGSQMEQLALGFFKKHLNYIRQFPFTWRSRFPNQSNAETIDEDIKLINDGLEIYSDSSEADSKLTAVVNKNPVCAQVIGDIYRRLCHGSYLRLTYNKSRRNQEEDRKEPVDWARYALRYDSTSPLVTGWYMIALGWYLEGLKHPKERPQVGQLFKRCILRAMWLNPKDALPHNLLGRYYYNVANLNWIERAVAKNLLGFKLEATFQESEQEFLRAHEIKNDWLPTGLWMARVLLAQKRPLEEVKGWIDFGLALEANEPTTEIERAELLELKAKLKLCN